MTNLLDHVAIIGAGLGGCALALALSLQDIPVTVYESRSPEAQDFASGVILSPNGLRILDRLGVLPRIIGGSYSTTHHVIKDTEDKIIGTSIKIDEARYGYRIHRVWRRLLLDELRKMLAERSVPIHYLQKFSGIISESSKGVKFRINESECQASLLIGVDGIYSTVRKYLAPGAEPHYTGILGVLSHVNASSVKLPSEEFEGSATLQGEDGAIFYISEDPQINVLMVGTQLKHPEETRGDLAVLQKDKDRLVEFYKNLYAGQGPTAKRIIDQVGHQKEELWIWPYLKIPHLAKWYSDEGRVMLVGDGAHAMPPSSGQGVNQALEDAYSLSLILAIAKDNPTVGTADVEVKEALAFWQELRQRKVDAIFEWTTNSQNVDRLPIAERKKLEEAGKLPAHGDLFWLYGSDIGKDVNDWIAERRAVKA